MPKTLKNFRLSDVAIEILARRSAALGVSEAAWIEMQIRAGDGLSKAGQAVMDSLPHFPDQEDLSPARNLGKAWQQSADELERNSLSPEVSAQRKAKQETKQTEKAKRVEEVKAALPDHWFSKGVPES